MKQITYFDVSNLCYEFKTKETCLGLMKIVQSFTVTFWMVIHDKKCKHSKITIEIFNHKSKCQFKNKSKC